MSSTVFQEVLEMLAQKEAELKDIKKSMRDLEKDVSIELEEKEIALKDLKKDVKELKEDLVTLRTDLQIHYVRKDDFKEFRDELRGFLQRIESKLDNKQDKQHGS